MQKKHWVLLGILWVVMAIGIAMGDLLISTHPWTKIAYICLALIGFWCSAFAFTKKSRYWLLILPIGFYLAFIVLTPLLMRSHKTISTATQQEQFETIA